MKPVKTLLLHFRPANVPEPALRFTLTWGLGGTAVLLVIIQLFSGLLLRFAYDPHPVAAYRSIEFIRSGMFFGPLVRNVHHWAGHLLILVAFLHMLRVFYSGAFQGKRQWNWIIGLAMGLLICLANFTGYLLPWDQLAFWAVTIATALPTYVPWIGEALQNIVLGGPEVGASTLLMFYNLHTGILPVLLVIAMAFHFWRIRKAGGVFVSEENRQTRRVPTGELFIREFAAAGVVFAALLLLAVFFDAPLLAMANPDVTPDTIRAPWYFVGFQELLLHLPPMVAVWLIPLLLIFFLGLLPFYGRHTGKAAMPTRTLFTLCVLSYAGLTLTGLLFRGPGMRFVLPW